jgi:glycosyltransferase involved in cell wall biosynthesis
MWLRGRRVAFSGAALWRQAVERVPPGLKRLVPLRLKLAIRNLLTRDVDPFSNYVFPEPAADIDPELKAQAAWLRPFFVSVGLNDEPAATFLALQAAGYPAYATRSDAERTAQVVRASGLFDEKYYRSNVGDIGDLDPALHYVIVGERMGFAPSERFDPAYYYERHPDLRRSFKSLLVHHATSGTREGRRATSIAAGLTFDRRRIDPQRETVLVVVHEASRTGAPILAYNIVKRLRVKYNVVTLLLSGGEIVSAFEDVSSAVVGPLRRKDWHPIEAKHLVRHLLSAYRFSYAIANSIDSRIVMKPLGCAFVPVIALVHEFASYLSPKGEMGRELGWATQTVFSAERVLQSARSDYPSLDNYKLNVLPQGPVEVPPAQAQEPAGSQQPLQAAMRPSGAQNAFVVLGCGTVYPRKGVDLFVACAAAIAARNAGRPIRFVWIGQRLPPDMDQGYFPKLLRQIGRSGVADRVAILEQVADLEPAYALADVFFLSSRLDPLPNVAIDSALRGLPIVCFENCSGIADILATDETARRSVVPHLDVAAAAELIVQLAADEPMRREIAAASRRLAEKNFDMERYVARLDAIGRDSMAIMRQREEDFATIEGDAMFDTVGSLGPHSEIMTRADAIRLFIARAAMLGTSRQPTANFYYRRPCAGFHPQIYAHENRNRYDIARLNPLAHFIRSGKPAGPWAHPLITPGDAADEKAADTKLKAALHVHLHYPELCAELLRMLASNRSRCDLLLTTNSRRKMWALKRATAGYDRGEVRISMVPNRGRDIGAFVTGLDRATVEQYDIIGHLHSKRSLFIHDRFIGERWRNFIWRNLIGHRHRMMDLIFSRMENDAGLGLVFPDDPHLSDWDHNLAIAERLAQRIGMTDPLPPFFNFPVGTMFWARSAAVAPLFGLGLGWEDYPEEPAPIDGTILHALERLLPFVAQRAGYRYAATSLPGVTW